MGNMPPEQKYADRGYARRIGVATNMWNIGAVMHELLRPATGPPCISRWFIRDVNGEPITVIGDWKEILDPVNLPYSKKFIDTLCYCLAEDPSRRATPEYLVAECQVSDTSLLVVKDSRVLKEKIRWLTSN